MEEKVLIGTPILGNFETDVPVGDLNDATLKYENGDFYLIKGASKFLLDPKDYDANLIIEKFETALDYSDHFIYVIDKNNETINVSLYSYPSIYPVTKTNEKLRLHCTHDLEAKIMSDDVYRDKLNIDNIINSKDDIVSFFKKKFMNKDSIFAHFNAHNKSELTIYANHYFAKCYIERPGLIAISDLNRIRNSKNEAVIQQIFGDIDFITWMDSTSFVGSDLSFTKNINPSEIFDAWDLYVKASKDVFENEVENFGLIKYKSMRLLNDGQIEFLLDQPLSFANVQEEQFKNTPLAFLSESTQDGQVPSPRNIEELNKTKYGVKARTFIDLGKCQNISSDQSKLTFNVPAFYEKRMDTVPGIIFMSDTSFQIESNRRKQVSKKINQAINPTVNMILRLSDPDVVDDRQGANYNPITKNVILKMLNNPNAVLSDTYANALKMAINTPDVALIQGPPGTGKSTLIVGLVTAIKAINKQMTILVSAEQHDALSTAVGKLSKSKRLIPPVITSHRHIDQDDEISAYEVERKHFENTRNLQKNLLNKCEEILRDCKGKDHRVDLINQFKYDLLDIEENNYSLNYISLVFDDMKKIISELGYYNPLSDEIHALQNLLSGTKSNQEVRDDELKSQLKSLINGQRTIFEAYESDDGIDQLDKLHDFLLIHGLEKDMLDDKTYQNLTSGIHTLMENNFNKYKSYVSDLTKKYCFENEKVDITNIRPKEIVIKMESKFRDLLKQSPKSFYDIIKDFKYRLNDLSAVDDICKQYSYVVGSVCAQSNASREYANLENELYDYVIIDEAARANPLDILIPMFLGIKVILLGDQKQLPQYINTEYINKLKATNKLTQSQIDILHKSLFEVMFDNLDKAYFDHRLKFRRTIQLNEQFRMHPVIGNFISNEFYNGTIKNAKQTENCINDYKMFNGKNIAWVDVSINEPNSLEEISSQSYKRPREVDAITYLIDQFSKQNPGRDLEIGVISYYKAQKNELEKRIFNKYEGKKNIEVGTVDSFQGKEFDILFISGVRSNKDHKIGFIDGNPTRINVSLSRAKKVLVFVGDSYTYSTNPHFDALIKYIKKEGVFDESTIKKVPTNY